MLIGNPKTTEAGELVRALSYGTGSDLMPSIQRLADERLMHERFLVFPTHYRKEWDYLLREGRCFGLGSRQVAVAAQFAGVQLFNPAASGKLFLVREVAGSSNGAPTDMTCRQEDTAFPTLIGAGNALDRVSAVVSVAEFRRGTNAAARAGAVFDLLVGNAANARNFFLDGQGRGDFLATLVPGTGLLLQIETVNNDLVCSMKWAEVDITGSYP